MAVTLEDLRVFAAVSRWRNLSAAARELDCSQSAVSQHVKRLESELGCALLKRGTRGVTITPAGERFAAAVSESLAALDAGKRQVAEMAHEELRRVRLATGSTSVRYIMSQALVRFRRQHPDAHLELHSATSTGACLEALRQDLVDLAFVTLADSADNLEQRPVIKAAWLLVVPEGHRLAGSSDPVELEHLDGLALISLPGESTSQTSLERALSAGGLTVPSTTQVEDWDTAVALVELGFGHAIVPAVPGRQLVAGRPLRARPIKGLAPITFGWAALRWDRLGPLALELAAMVAAELGAQLSDSQLSDSQLSDSQLSDPS